MKQLCRCVFVLLSGLFITPALAVEIKINWPQDAFDGYTIQRAMKQPSSVSGSYDLPEGQKSILAGPGFLVRFTVEDGKVVLPSSLDAGVQFDPNTNTFSFLTSDFHLEMTDLSGGIGLDNLKPSEPISQSRSFKLVVGRHFLSYAGNRVGFDIDPDGVVSLLEDIKGMTSRGSTVSIKGIGLEFESNRAKWSVNSLNVSSEAAKTTLQLLPGHYFFQSGGQVAFFINNDGLAAMHGEGPYEEVLDLQDTKGAPLATIRVPDGQAKRAARLQREHADQQLHDRVLATSAAAKWKQDFQLVEKMKIYDFPEQQISYPINLPATVRSDDLTLLAFTENTVRLIPFQISAGNDHATISFRTDLPKGASQLFRLVFRSDAGSDIPPSAPQPPVLKPTSDPREALLGNGLLIMKVPAGHQDFPGGKPLSEAPAPILGMARTAQPQPWMATTSFSAPDSIRVTSLDAQAVETGPVFTIYRVTYRLLAGKTYTVDLELRAGESHVAIAESVGGFTPEDQAFLRLNYGKGLLDPDRRLAASLNGADHGYDRYRGPYDRQVSTDDRYRPWELSAGWLNYDPQLDDSREGRLPFRLGIYIPNTLGVLHAATFYQEYGTDALLLSVNHLSDWRTCTRALWTDFRSVDNLRFYSQDGRKYMSTGLAGPAFWALGLISRSEVVMRTCNTVPAGPEVWLSSQLGIWNLNDQKDRSIDFPEKLDPAGPFDTAGRKGPGSAEPGPMSFEQYKQKLIDKYVVEYLLDFLPFFGGLNGRSFPTYYDAYARSRASWTPEQREQVRQILVFLTDLNDGDEYQPHHSMLSGHPNFLMDAKQNLPIAAATFPQNPKARYWRDSFMAYYNEFLDKYARDDVPELNTRGGRWTENIACYFGQCIVGMLNSERALKAYDGTSLATVPKIFSVIRWARDAFMSPHKGVRMIPPEGAHAITFEPGGSFWNALFALSAELAPGDPQLAEEMHWIETNGKEGKKPDIHSQLFTDYGPVFHYDFGGPHESYAHLQNINGMSYRWGHAGIVYYGAKDKAWSYNGREANGDEFNWNTLTAFTSNGAGLAPGPTDQLLYDFDFAQLYRQPGKPADDYVARALVLVRDDYLVLADEVKSAETPGTFRWASFFDLPEIYQVKPGAALVETQANDMAHYRPEQTPRVIKVRSYSGKGDFLTVVAPSPAHAEAKPFGAIVNGEYVFAAQQPTEVKEGPASFSGRYGYARPNQLALFGGSEISLNGFELRREGGDFGLSASIEGNRIWGRVVGRSGGKAFVAPPMSAGLDLTKASVTINGQPVPHSVEQGAIVFVVEIAQRDGIKHYEISF